MVRSVFNNIYLIGFMGTGKTTVGRILAQKMDWLFSDVDIEIEQSMGMSIPSIFHLYGENFFRQREHLMLKALAKKTRTVVATGGGIVLFEDNMNIMKTSGIIICLEASIDTILEHVGTGKGRPMLNASDLRQRISELLHQRERYYHKADIIVSVDFKSPEMITDEIMSQLNF